MAMPGLLALVPCLLLLCGCGKRETRVEMGDRSQELFLSNADEPAGLDPQTSIGVVEANIQLALFEGLVTGDPKENMPRPGVAESWDISLDGKVYTFHLRHNARWSNGDLVTANDFVQSYKRMLMPSLAAQYSYMLYPIANAEAYNLGTVSNFDQVGVKALDDFTLRLTLHSVTPYLLIMMIHQSWYPVPIKTIEKYGALDDEANTWTLPGHFVGNGPFILKEWRMNSHVLVEKSPTYWDTATVKLNKIYFDPTASYDTEERMFRSGQLHDTYQASPSKIAYYQKNKPSLIEISPLLATYYYKINVLRPPLNDKRVREALAMSIDRRAITETISRGGELPAECLTPPKTAGYTSKAQIHEDIPAARKLLADAGYPDGKGFPTIELLFNTLQSHKAIAEALQEMWKENLHIDVRLHNEEWKVYLDSLHHTNYDLGRAGWIGDYQDPSTFLDCFLSDSGNNETGWSNSQFDAYCEAAANTGDQMKRFENFQKAEAILVDEMPIIPIYFYTMPRLIRPSVKGFYPNLLDQHNYKYVYLDPKGD
jgi:oligopeptide transport system substrate-binding protein